MKEDFNSIGQKPWWMMKGKILGSPKGELRSKRDRSLDEQVSTISFEEIEGKLWEILERHGAKSSSRMLNLGASPLHLSQEGIHNLIGELTELESSHRRAVAIRVIGATRTVKDFGRKPRIVDNLSFSKTARREIHLQVYYLGENKNKSVFSGQILLYKRQGDMFSFPVAPGVPCRTIHSSDVSSIYKPVKAGVAESEILWTESRQTKEVDVVITWVNKEDHGWQRLWADAFGERNTSDQDSDRYTCSNELLYCIRSVAMNLPWTRKIHIFSNCRPPAWLDVNNPRVNWVDHTSVIEAQYLPTFNSHAIETYLHHLEDLTEDFLYLNDDFIVALPTGLDYFYDNLGRPNLNCEDYAYIRPSYLKVKSKEFVRAAVNTYCLLEETYSTLPPALNLHCHIPYALNKSLLRSFEGKYTQAMKRTRSSRLRSSSDINLTSFAVFWYGYLEGRVTLRALTAGSDYIIVRPSNIASLYVSSRRPRFLCFNDGEGTSMNKAYKQFSKRLLDSLFPYKSFAEK